MHWTYNKRQHRGGENFPPVPSAGKPWERVRACTRRGLSAHCRDRRRLVRCCRCIQRTPGGHGFQAGWARAWVLPRLQSAGIYAARYRKLTVGERLAAIETQLNADMSWSGSYDTVRLPAHEWAGVVSRLRELNSMDISSSDLKSTRIYTYVKFLLIRARGRNAPAAELARALVRKWEALGV